MGLHHDHSHSHEHAHDSHVVDRAGNQRRVAIAAVLTGAFMVAEVIGGVISGSLALLADAGHMMTDFAALAMAWAAFILAKRPASNRHTYGFDRMTVLAAFVNGLTLILVCVWIAVEAIKRFREPAEVLAGPMLTIAVIGLIVNLLVMWVLAGGDKKNLNVRGALLHVIGDALGSVAAIGAAIVIMQTGWTPIDPILSVLVAVLILRSAVVLVRDSAHILLEGAPADLDRDDIADDLETNIPGVEAVSHVHVWSLSSGRMMVTLEAHISEAYGHTATSDAIKSRLKQVYNLGHATVETRRGTASPSSASPCALHTDE